MIQEFKDFINRGNVMDLAVAVILGAAFSAIIGSLVEDIITPIIGMVMGGVDFKGVGITVGEAFLGIGNFVQAVIDFLVIAFVVFMMVKALNKMNPPAEEAPAEDPADVKLLTEIRDLLSRN